MSLSDQQCSSTNNLNLVITKSLSLPSIANYVYLSAPTVIKACKGPPDPHGTWFIHWCVCVNVVGHSESPIVYEAQKPLLIQR